MPKKKTIEVRAPKPYGKYRYGKYLKTFLAGSIEQGAAVDWQEEVTRMFDGLPEHRNWRIPVILNPRRKNWDSTVNQSADNKKFRQQVEWELKAIEEADEVIMYFDPKTKSPISLLELGLYARHGTLSVVCPSGFWRKGNVDIVCERFSIPQYPSLEYAVEAISRKNGLLQ